MSRNKLENLKLSSDIDIFAKAIAECTKESVPDLLKSISHANDNEEMFKYLIGTVINKIVTFHSENTVELGKTFSTILDMIKNLNNPMSIYFLLLENSIGNKNEIFRL
jgi:hypothetical protein